MNERAPHIFDAPAVALLRRCLYAASNAPTRPVLSAASIGGHTAVTTDSYRLAIAYFDGDPIPHVLLGATQLEKSLPRTGAWTLSENYLTRCPPEWQYPRWEKLLRDARWEYSYVADRDTLTTFFDALPAQKRGQTVTARITATGELSTSDLHDRMEHPDPWDHRGITLETVGPTQTTYFNAYYLRDLIRACTTETIHLECGGVSAPMMVRQPGMTHLVMPMLVVH